jgi:hypothetical protein
VSAEPEVIQATTADPRLPVTYCRGRGCNAEIVWVKTPAGKWTPVDAKPVKVWVLEVVDVANETGLHGRPGKLVTGHVPHWATCPAVAQFSRNRGGDR